MPAAARACRATRHQLARHPRVVGLGELEARERILAVRVESGRHVDDLRPVALERGQPALAHRLAERVAAAARRQRDVDHVGGDGSRCPSTDTADAGSRHHQHPRVAGEDVLGAVAVVDVEVDRPRRARCRARSSACAAPTATLLNRQKPIARSRSAWCPGGRTAQNAVLHSPRITRSVASTTRAGRVPRRRQRMRVERGVGVDEVQPCRGARRLDRVDVARRRARARSARASPPAPCSGAGRRRARRRSGGRRSRAAGPGTRDGTAPCRAAATTGG